MESNELDMLSSFACLEEVCDESTSSCNEVHVMEFATDTTDTLNGLLVPRCDRRL